MPTKTIDKDILPKIDAGEAVELDQQSLRAKVGSRRGCETSPEVGGAELEVCYDVGLNGVSISAELKTRVGSIPLGSVELTRDDNCGVLEGSGAGFKAEVSACFDFSDLKLSIEYKLCPPILPCREGSISINL